MRQNHQFSSTDFLFTLYNFAAEVPGKLSFCVEFNSYLVRPHHGIASGFKNRSGRKLAQNRKDMLRTESQ
jgi:hypothetical protein